MTEQESLLEPKPLATSYPKTLSRGVAVYWDFELKKADQNAAVAAGEARVTENQDPTDVDESLAESYRDILKENTNAVIITPFSWKTTASGAIERLVSQGFNGTIKELQTRLGKELGKEAQEKIKKFTHVLGALGAFKWKLGKLQGLDSDASDGRLVASSEKFIIGKLMDAGQTDPRASVVWRLLDGENVELIPMYEHFIAEVKAARAPSP